VFTLSSLGCALSPSLWPSSGSESSSGGGSRTDADQLGLLINAFPPQGRSRAVRIWAAVSALAAAAGPVVGGVLVSTRGGLSSWSTFRSESWPSSSPSASPRQPGPHGHAPPRPGRLIRVGVSIGALALGLVKGPAWGWAAPATVGAFVVAVAGTAWFWWALLAPPGPVVDRHCSPCARSPGPTPPSSPSPWPLPGICSRHLVDARGLALHADADRVRCGARPAHGAGFCHPWGKFAKSVGVASSRRGVCALRGGHRPRPGFIGQAAPLPH